MIANDAENDVFRDTPVRFLGYANEIGEAFRAFISRVAYRLSYGVAVGYVIADASHKGLRAAQTDEEAAGTAAGTAVFDTILWQGLASVILPGICINRTVWAAGRALRSNPTLARWGGTAIGLGMIPLIVKPIDGLVDDVMDSYVRPLYPRPTGQRAVSHSRD